MRSLAIFSYLLISSSIYLGETPVGITVNEVDEYNELLSNSQLFIEYDIDNETFNTSNTLKMNEQISIGNDFVLLNALILMEIDEQVNADAESNMQLTSIELMDRYYNEEFYNTFEGAVLSGNSKYLTDLLNNNDQLLIENVLDNYNTYFSYDKKSSIVATLNSIKTTPSRLALFLKMFNEKELPFCNSSMTYLKNLITNKDEDYKSQEFFIVNESRTGSTYINIGYINSYNEHALKMFVEVQESTRLNKIDKIRMDNYLVMNATSEENDLGFFGE